MNGVELLEFLEVEATRFLKDDQCNLMKGDWGDERIWETPLLGAARGCDAIFETFKDKVDERHWTPTEAFAAGGFQAGAEELSVVSWVLPHTSVTKKDNAQCDEMPSERWARSRIFGEKANFKLRGHIVSSLKNAGYEAVAPLDLADWKWLKSDRYVYACSWSERHIAYACGLGTFGLSGGLITPLGKAIRVSSVVLRGNVEPTPRPYSRHDEYCPFKTKKICGVCIKRCPAGALSEHGINKPLCKAYLSDKTAPYVETHYGFEGYGCGLCQTGVPCSSGIPAL